MATSTTWAALVPEIARKVYAGTNTILVTGTGTANTTVVDSTRAFTSVSAYSYDGMGFYAYNNGAGSGPDLRHRLGPDRPGRPIRGTGRNGGAFCQAHGPAVDRVTHGPLSLP